MKELKDYAISPLTDSEKKTLDRIKAHYNLYTTTFKEEPTGWVLKDMLFVDNCELSIKLIIQSNWYHQQVLKCI